MGLDASAYARQLKYLLSPGVAWNVGPDSMLSKVALAIADELARVHSRADALREEMDPRTTIELLSEWEAVLGLPDPCAPAGQTLQERRAAVVAKFTKLGGQSPAYFIAFAQALGYTITITEFRPFRASVSGAGDALCSEDWAHTWRVNAPENTVRDFCAGSSVAGEALRDWGNEELECAISARKPAHTIVQFAYS